MDYILVGLRRDIGQKRTLAARTQNDKPCVRRVAHLNRTLALRATTLSCAKHHELNKQTHETLSFSNIEQDAAKRNEP